MGEVMEEDMNDEKDLINLATTGVMSFYKDPSGKRIRPFPYMWETTVEDCRQAIVRAYEKLDLQAVFDLIDSLPEHGLGIDVMPKEVVAFHKEILRRLYDEGLSPIPRRILEGRKTEPPVLPLDVARSEAHAAIKGGADDAVSHGIHCRTNTSPNH